MFKKQDEEFDRMAVDPVRRRTKIAELTWRRTLIGSCAFVMMLAALVGIWSGGRGAMGGVFAAAITWGSFIRIESDLRLLRIVESLQKGGDEKPTA
jgi:hypothetical protein